MYVTWQTVLLGFLAVCGGFTTVCVAAGWFIKIVKGIKKPGDDVKNRLDAQDKKLENDNNRLRDLEDQYKYVSSAIGVLMRCDLVMLGHMRTNNNTGQMANMEEEIQDFLIKR